MNNTFVQTMSVVFNDTMLTNFEFEFDNDTTLTPETTSPIGCNCKHEASLMIAILFGVIIGCIVLICLCNCICSTCECCHFLITNSRCCMKVDVMDDSRVHAHDINSDEDYVYRYDESNYANHGSMYGQSRLRLDNNMVRSEPTSYSDSDGESDYESNYNNNNNNSNLHNIQVPTDFSNFYQVLVQSDYIEIDGSTCVDKHELCNSTVVNDNFVINVYDTSNELKCGDCSYSTESICDYIESETNEFICTICLNPIDADCGDDDNVKLNHCNHKFHASCINKWFQSENLTCPICRHQFK